MTVRRLLRIHGTVQGVGFRPFACRLADTLGLAGMVANDDEGVWCEIQGAAGSVVGFIERLRQDAPPLARIEEILVSEIEVVRGEDHFVIAESTRGSGDRPMSVPPDVAPCAACRSELRDPADRRFGYAFTCCTDCGPRYSVVRSLPYDRQHTSMQEFPLCADCLAEYEDPTDRRHHAQATSCPDCGPVVTLTIDGGLVDGDPVEQAARLIVGGEILALKGVGGYQLVCRADREQVVSALRAGKHREEKPFALLVSDLHAARRLVDLDPTSVAALTGPEAPIVLAPRRSDAPVAPAVAPGTRTLGVMLPASTLHTLLVAAVGDIALVCTSGNRSDEPIAVDDERIEAELGHITGAVLAHDRAIERRADDSVGHTVAGDFQLLRRARGFAPRPVRLTETGPTVLAVGAELKSTVCLAIGDDAHLSVHLGDLEHPAALEAFETAVADLLSVSRASPELVVHDRHVEYLSTKFALAADLGPTLAVQHHHAHLAACLADNLHRGPAIGVTFDGLGWGADDTLWGGEFLVGDAASCDRVAHLTPVPMPGGAAAIREPWRMAVAHLDHTVGTDRADLPVVQRHSDAVASVLAQCRADRSALTSSVGRLFDSVAALCDLGDRVTHEGQAAIRLEQSAGDTSVRYEVDIIDGEPRLVDTSGLIAAIIADRRAGVDVAAVAGGFHRWVADMIVTVATDIAATGGPRTVALTGGVFQNRLLVELVVPSLHEAGFVVLRHRQVPPNDGGISLGQAAIGRARLAAGRLTEDGSSGGRG